MKNNQSHLPWLDGLRGGAAVWVLLSHVQILTGMRYIPVLSWGSLAVDLFMMLSGFLMAHHYIERQNSEPWNTKKTIALFWIRRFFRIAPLFYLLLVIAFMIGPWLGECRATIALVWPSTATPMERYNDNSVTNFLIHLSFLFGALPHWSFRSPLPDWSIGLEMQFYLAFPIIMLAMSTAGPIKTSIGIVTLALGFRFLFPDIYHAFQMPSLLLMKLQVFLIGIWIAYARWHGSMKLGFIASMGIALIWAILERNQIAIARVGLVVLMFYLMDNGTMPLGHSLRRLVDKLRGLLSNKLSVFLGDASYASYLLHLLIVLPIAAWLTTFPQYLALHGSTRFFICLALTLPLIYLGAYFLFHYVEKFGIDMGKLIIKILKDRPQPVS